MNCDESRPLLAIDADGELDLIRHLELRAHLETCPVCAEIVRAMRARKTALRAALPRFTAGLELAANIKSKVSEKGAEKVIPTASRPGESLIRRSLWQYGGIAAMLTVSLLIGYGVGHREIGERRLLDEAIGDHVRSLQASHLTDVASTDQHTVKPWFAGKLDFSPPVIDLAAIGFPLFGGRLERLNGQPVAALVFRRHQHTLNLFIWPNGVETLRRGSTEHDGYRTIGWSQNGFNFLAVSDISASDLELFAQTYSAEH